MDIKMVFEIIGVLFAVVSGCWTLYVYFKNEMEKMEMRFTESFKTIFLRMDEKQKGYYDKFVQKELYDQEIRHQEQRNNDKFISIQRVFDTNFQNLEKTLGEIKEMIKEYQKNVKKE